jgi:hypothetical protein
MGYLLWYAQDGQAPFLVDVLHDVGATGAHAIATEGLSSQEEGISRAFEERFVGLHPHDFPQTLHRMSRRAGARALRDDEVKANALRVESGLQLQEQQIDDGGEMQVVGRGGIGFRPSESKNPPAGLRPDVSSDRAREPQNRGAPW